MFLEYKNKQKLYYFIFEDLIYQYLTIMTPKVVIIGGSYAGLAALNTLKLLITKNSGAIAKSISITLIEPKSGFLNILGLPKSIVNKNLQVNNMFHFVIFKV